MKNKLIGKVEPKCKYCKFGTLSPSGESVLCHKKGILDKDFSCKKFSYDVFKREPEQPPTLPKFDKNDFEL